MTPELFRKRTQNIALRIIHLVESLPKTHVATVLGNQLLRAGTSVGANYRAACRARSQREFVAKMGIVEEECDETIYWIHLLAEDRIYPMERLEMLRAEANEILSMTVSSINTVRRRTRK